eukprot:1834831-Amphidinium_carterae.1
MVLKWAESRRQICPSGVNGPWRGPGGPAADPQVSADLSTIRVWHRRILAGKLEWPLPDSMWDNALRPGRGRGPTRNLKQLAERLGWLPALGGWTCN